MTLVKSRRVQYAVRDDGKQLSNLYSCSEQHELALAGPEPVTSVFLISYSVKVFSFFTSLESPRTLQNLLFCIWAKARTMRKRSTAFHAGHSALRKSTVGFSRRLIHVSVMVRNNFLF